MKSANVAAPGLAIPYILAACTAISVLSTDLITPSIPDLPQALGTNMTAAQMTVSINLMAYAIAQLVHGPLADAFGRRFLLIVAFLLFVVISVMCAFANSIEWLLAGRFMQGLVSSVPSVVIVLMIRELYDSHRALAVMALYGATLGVAPAIGPLMGGYLHVWFGWEAGFLLIAALALFVVFCVWRQVPETLPAPRPLDLRKAIASYGRLLSLWAFVAPMLGVSLCFSAFYAYVTSAPVIFIDQLGMPTQQYGLTHVVIIAAFILGNILSGRMSRRMEAASMLRFGAGCVVAAMLLLLLPVLAGVTAVVPMVAAMAFYGLGMANVLAAGPLVVLDAAHVKAPGTAAALLGSFQLGIASLAGYVSALCYDGTALPMALTMAVAVGLGALLIWRRPADRRVVPGGRQTSAPGAFGDQSTGTEAQHDQQDQTHQEQAQMGRGL